MSSSCHLNPAFGLLDLAFGSADEILAFGLVHATFLVWAFKSMPRVQTRARFWFTGDKPRRIFLVWGPASPRFRFRAHPLFGFLQAASFWFLRKTPMFWFRRAPVLEGCRTRLRSPSPLISTPRLPIRRDGMRTRIVTPRCCLLLPLVCSSSLLTLLSLSFAGGAVPAVEGPSTSRSSRRCRVGGRQSLCNRRAD